MIGTGIAVSDINNCYEVVRPGVVDGEVPD